MLKTVAHRLLQLSPSPSSYLRPASALLRSVQPRLDHPSLPPFRSLSMSTVMKAEEYAAALNVARPPPAVVGQVLNEVNTPALCVDLDVMEANMKAMSASIKPYPSLILRPHAKAHKSGEIAQKLVREGGAVGVCCQKMCEVEEMARWGVEDIFYSNEIANQQKADRFAQIGKETGTKLSILVDDTVQVALLENAAKKNGINIDVIIEVNVGQDRCGVEPGADAVPLAQSIINASHLTFKGIQAYQGWAQHVRDKEERRAIILDKVAGGAKATIDALKKAGIDCNFCTGGGTGTYPFEAESGVFNEIQPGSYIFMDADYGRNLVDGGRAFRDFGFSLFILAEIMSKPNSGRAVTDAGLKAVSLDSGVPTAADYIEGKGAVPREDLTYKSGGDEHGIVIVSDEARSSWTKTVGDRIVFIPGHCDPTVNMHDWLVGVRKGKVEKVFAVGGRGPGH